MLRYTLQCTGRPPDPNVNNAEAEKHGFTFCVSSLKTSIPSLFPAVSMATGTYRAFNNDPLDE